MQRSPDSYKIGVNVPPEYLDALMDAISGAVEPFYPKYERAFMYWPVKGTWMPMEGADPFDGEIGKVSVADEIRLEFAVKEKDVETVVRTIRDIHPYEEPAIDVIPMISWKSFL